jgi:hypothetical protein
MSLHYCQQGRRVPTVFVVECKRCRRHVPAGVDAFPVDNRVVLCTLCGELRRYRPSEIFLGWPDLALGKQQVCRAQHFHQLRKRA